MHARLKVDVPPTDTIEEVGILSHEEIAARAYELFVERSGADGHDLDDWLQAERELLEERQLRLGL